MLLTQLLRFQRRQALLRTLLSDGIHSHGLSESLSYSPAFPFCLLGIFSWVSPQIELSNVPTLSLSFSLLHAGAQSSMNATQFSKTFFFFFFPISFLLNLFW